MTTPVAHTTERISPSEFMSAAPRSVSGSSPWATRYAGEIRRAWLEFAAEDSRTVQTHLGPSELGVECDRQVAGKLVGIPATNHVVDPWPSIRGKALHAHAEDVFKADNLRKGLDRWVTEYRVTPHPEHPGTADLYDDLEKAVVDHKFLGESTMAKIRKLPPRKYRRQLFLYGLGYLLEGRTVLRIAVAAYPATAGSLDGLYVWEHHFADEAGNIYPDVLAELTNTFDELDRRKAQAQLIREGRLTFNDVPAVPDPDECYFCDFYRPQAAKDGGTGCPGSVSAS